MKQRIENGVFWHIYPLGFVGAERSSDWVTGVIPRLRKLENWLDYAVELGVSGLLLGPVFSSSTHGYDTIDHMTIDPRLGEEADFIHFIEAARSRGLDILADGVFNHVGREFPRFCTAAMCGPDSEPASWFRRKIVDDGHPSCDYDTFEGHDALITLNHGEVGGSNLYGRCHDVLA